MAVSKIIQLLFKVKGAGETKSKTGEVDGALAKLAKTAEVIYHLFRNCSVVRIFKN